ncbi:MAG: MFS transporter [bacterium]|nr:MFS transporter [bacterium]
MLAKLSKQKTIIITTILIDVIGIGIVIPVMPYFVQSIGASAATVTSLFAVYSACSFLSSPLLGSLSDKYGRRPALIISLFTTAIGWLVFGGATTVVFLFVGRIIDGMAAGNFTIAQSYIADISKDAKDRTANMGMIGAVFGVGFIIGPAIGALLSHISMSFPFYFVGCLAAVNTIAALFFLPETNHNLHAEKVISLNPFHPLRLAIQDKILRARYIALFLFSLAIAIQHSIFALFLQSIFHLDVSGAGYIFIAMGVLMVINQGWLLKNFWLKRFTQSWLEVWMFLFFAISFFTMSVASAWVFAIGTLVMILCQSILRAVMFSRITGFADVRHRGEVAGIMAAIGTIGMIAGPLSVGAIYIFNPHLPFIISGVILLAAFFVMLHVKQTPSESQSYQMEVESVEVT